MFNIVWILTQTQNAENGCIPIFCIYVAIGTVLWIIHTGLLQDRNRDRDWKQHNRKQWGLGPCVMWNILHIFMQPIFSCPGSGVLETDSVNRPLDLNVDANAKVTCGKPDITLHRTVRPVS